MSTIDHAAEARRIMSKPWALIEYNPEEEK